VLLTRRREQLPTPLPNSIAWFAHLPLGQLLPHAAGLVHHGGIGTLAEALKAGVPQLITPFAFDQFDNAARLQSLGVADALPAARLRARTLARRLLDLERRRSVQPEALRRWAESLQKAPDAAALMRQLEQVLGLGA
jgi:rhamnosyltransferase subunit B